MIKNILLNIGFTLSLLSPSVRWTYCTESNNQTTNYIDVYTINICKDCTNICEENTQKRLLATLYFPLSVDLTWKCVICYLTEIWSFPTTEVLRKLFTTQCETFWAMPCQRPLAMRRDISVYVDNIRLLCHW